MCVVLLEGGTNYHRQKQVVVASHGRRSERATERLANENRETTARRLAAAGQSFFILFRLGLNRFT